MAWHSEQSTHVGHIKHAGLCLLNGPDPIHYCVMQIGDICRGLESGEPAAVAWSLNALSLITFRSDLPLANFPGLLPTLLQVPSCAGPSTSPCGAEGSHHYVL